VAQTHHPVAPTDSPQSALETSVLEPEACLLSWPYADRRSTVKAAGPHPLRRVSDAVELRRSWRTQLLDAIRDGSPLRWDAMFAIAVVAGDTVAVVGAVAVAGLIAPQSSSVGEPSLRRFAFAILPLTWIICVHLQRGYERAVAGAGTEELRRITTSTAAFATLLLAVAFATDLAVTPTYVATAGLLTMFGSLASRFAGHRVLRAARAHGRCLTDVILVGHPGPVRNLAQKLRREPRSAYRVVGACVPEDSDHWGLEAAAIPVLGGLYEAPQVVRRTGAGAVAVTGCAEMNDAALRQLAWDLEGTGAGLIVAPALLEITGPRLHLRPVAGMSLLTVAEPEFRGARRVVKALMDRTFAAAACVLLLPVFLALVFAIRATSEGPAFYRQTRIGRHGKEFRLWKFRSMYADADVRLPELTEANACADGLLFKVRDDPRITRVGRWLRKYSLDELPQLFNVLTGDMSLVGPRPPLPTEVARYGAAVNRRLLVKPGVTGLWQISGRSDLSWNESVRLDLSYVENWSLMLDLSILWKTAFTVLRGSGAY